jgi:cyanophycinase-like exopeptidase
VSTPAFALLGSGEFDPWTIQIDEWLTTRSEAPGSRVLVIPTACAAEGDEVFDMWASKGLDHYGSLGIPAEVLPLKTREDAARPDLAAALDGSAVAYFSGGNPAYLARVLADTPFWRALRSAMTRGLAYAGCSAGVVCLGDRALDNGRRSFDEALWQPGLGVFPRCFFGAHWDMLDGYVPGLKDFIVASVPDGDTLVGIDENTAMLGDGEHWRLAGVGSVNVLSQGEWVEHAPGSTFEQRLGG